MSDIPDVIDPANVQNYPRKYIDEIGRLRAEVARLRKAAEWADDTWPDRDSDYYRPDHEEAMAALRAALRGDTAPAQPINSADGVTWHTVTKPAPAGGER